jgi:hypothetical protein
VSGPTLGATYNDTLKRISPLLVPNVWHIINVIITAQSEAKEIDEAEILLISSKKERRVSTVSL